MKKYEAPVAPELAEHEATLLQKLLLGKTTRQICELRETLSSLN